MLFKSVWPLYIMHALSAVDRAITEGRQRLTVSSIGAYSAWKHHPEIFCLCWKTEQKRKRERNLKSLLRFSSSRNSSVVMLVRWKFLLRSSRIEVLLVILYRLIERGSPRVWKGKFRISISINQFSEILLGVMQYFFFV